MSLAVFLVRLATVQALKGETLAGDQVFDAPLDPLEDAVEAKRPMIAVFSGVAGGKVEGLDLVGAEIVSELVIQVFLPNGVEVSTGGGSPLRIDTRGSGAELALEIVSRQIVRTLMASASEWAELWRCLVFNIENAQQQPFALMRGSGGNAVAVAAREITFDVVPIMEPPVGEELPELWTRAFGMIRALPGMEAIADWLEAEASTPSDLETWRRAQASLGLTLTGTKAIGLGPEETVQVPPEPEVDE